MRRELTIAEAGRDLRSGRTTAVELVRQSLKRIQALDPVFHCFISHDPDLALEAAKVLDGELAAGHDRGPVHGIPVAVKDNIATLDFPTTFGSRIGRGFHTNSDAEVVRRLKDAGAVVIGKNNLHEFALGATNANREFGDVPNPWNLDRIPGGSSGGSAAAVAVGEVFASLGSDSGGSVRMPAAMCGLVGVKPTHGRVSLRGLIGGAPTMDHIGPLTRTVEDAAIIHDVLTGHDPLDPESSPGDAPAALPSLHEGVRGVRIGLIANRSMGAVQDDVVSAVRASAETLASLGAIITDTELTGVELAPYAAVAVAYPEVSAGHQRWIRERRADYGTDIRPLIELGQIFSARQYILAQRSRRHLKRQLDKALEGFDLLAMPTVAVTAGLRDGTVEPLEGDTGSSLLFTLIRFTVLFNMTGYPAISIPCGVDTRGLPIGLQLAGPPDSEPLLLRVARSLEACRPWTLPDLPLAQGVK